MYCFSPANSTDIELRGERDSNEMTKQDTQFPDLAGSRMQASTTEKDDNAAHSSSLMLSIRQNLRAKLVSYGACTWQPKVLCVGNPKVHMLFPRMS